MANTPLKIKTSLTSNTPAVLNIGEPAYSYSSNTLFIGSTTDDGAIPIGGWETYIRGISSYLTSNLAFDRANNTVNANTGGTITGDLTIRGNLSIIGGSIGANVPMVLIGDNIITLNTAISQTGQPTMNAGIEIDRGAQPNTYLIWNETVDRWQFSNDGVTFDDMGGTSAGQYANAAFDRANAAYADSNTKVLRAGDTMTGALGFFGPNFRDFAIGQYQTGAGYGIDFWANTGTSYAQINYGNTNYVYVDAGTAAIQSPNVFISAYTSGIAEIHTTDGVHDNYWRFDNAGELTWPDGTTQNTSPFATAVYANSAYRLANAAYLSQNATGQYANSAFIKANSVYESQNATGNVANAAFYQANAAFISQNATGQYANAAFTLANGAFIHANSGFIQANAAYQSQNATGNVANAAFANANGAFAAANAAFANANGAFAKANAAFANANGAFAMANASYNTGNAAFIRANNSLNANVGGQVTGDVTIVGNLTSNTLVTTGSNGSITGANAIFTNYIFAANGNVDLFIYSSLAYAQSNAALASANASFSNANGAFAKANGAFANANGAFAAANAAYIQANSAFIQTNAAFNHANSAYESQNATGQYANAAFTVANGAFIHANSGFIKANASFDHANAAFANANGAFASANAGYTHANSAFDHANSGFIQANSGYIHANSAYDRANQRYIILSNTLTYIDGATGNVWGGSFSSSLKNTWSGVYNSNNSTALYTFASAGANVMSVQMDGSLFVGEGFVTDALGVLPSYGGWIVAASGIKSVYNVYGGNDVQAGQNLIAGGYVQFGDGTTQNTSANSAGNYANAAFLKANAGILHAQSAFHHANSGFIHANSAYVSQNATGQYANAAFIRANNSLDANNGGRVTGFIDITQNVSIGKYIDLATDQNNPTKVEGRIFYDKDQHALGYYNESDMTFQIGQETVVRVWNNSGSTITDGKVVRVSGSSSSNGFPAIDLADAATKVNSEAIGITTTVIPHTGYGYVTVQGKINGLDTSLIPTGTELYLSATPGGYQTTPVAPPGVPLVVGYVVTSDVTNGAILLKTHLMEGSNKSNGAILFGRNGLIDQDATTLFWDYANNRLGVGTDTPQANLHVTGSGLFTGNVTISGNLNVTNANFISTSELTVTGNTIVMNQGATGAPTINAALIVNRGSSPNSYILWDESIDEWTLSEGDGASHILTSSKTAVTWDDYGAFDSYEKQSYPIGSNLSKGISEQANAAFATANTGLNHAISGFIQANAAYDMANAAYLSQNATGQYANSAFIEANSAFGHANAAYISQNATGQYANSAFVHANAAYQSQNATGQYANSAFIQANAAFITGNSGFIQANAAFNHANASYAYANTLAGGAAIDNVARDAANSSGIYANGAFVQANSGYNLANSIANNSTVAGTSNVANYVNLQPKSGSGVHYLVLANAATGNIAVGGNTQLYYQPSTDSLYSQKGVFGQSVQTTSILAAALTATIFNTSATTIRMGGAALTINIGNTGGITNVFGTLAVNGVSVIGFTQGAYDTGNSAFIQSNAAFDHANAAFAAANNVFPQIQPSYDTANAAFLQANGAIAHAQSAFNTQNTTGSYANSAFIAANAAFLQANDGIVHAQSAFNAQNTTGNYANSAFIQANAAFGAQNATATYANSAFIQANAAYVDLNTVSIYANTPSYVANSAAIYANGAFVQANVANTNANAASNYANAGFIIANSGFIQANSAFFHANDAFNKANSGYDAANSGGIYANGAFATANSASSYANGAFQQANVALYQANAAYDTVNTVAIYANTPDYVANSAATYANGAFQQANVALYQANAGFIIANSGFIQANYSFAAANSAGQYANAAFLAANNALDTWVRGQANAAFIAANSAWNHANAAYNKANTGGGGGGTANATTQSFQTIADGITSTFSLGYQPSDANSSVFVSIGGIVQTDNVDYVVSASNSTISFNEPPPAGEVIRAVGFVNITPYFLDVANSAGALIRAFNGIGDGITATYNIGFNPVTANNLFVFVGGVAQNDTAYTVNPVANTITFGTAPGLNENIRVTGYDKVNPYYIQYTSSNVTPSVYESTANGNTATFNLGFNPQIKEALTVTIDGIVQPLSVYSINTTANTITFDANPANGELVRVVTMYTTINPYYTYYIPANVTPQVYETTATGLVSTFNLGWNPVSNQALTVSIDGVIQPPSSYTVSNTSNTITFNTTPVSGEYITVTTYGAINVLVVNDSTITFAKFTNDVRSFINTSFDTANSASIYANGAFVTANAAATTGKAIAMSIVFGG